MSKSKYVKLKKKLVLIPGGRMEFDLTHARYDRGHCLTPGLFRSLKKGERKKNKMDINYQYGKRIIRFIGFEPLGVDDMRLLQAIVAMGGPSKCMMDLSYPEGETAKKLTELLEPKLKALTEKSLVVKTTFYALLKEMGYASDDKKTHKQIIASLIRLSNVTVLQSDISLFWSSQLLSFVTKTDDGRLCVALNPRLTYAILGGTQYTYISMNEIRTLKSDVARLIHQRLSGIVDPGKNRVITLRVLMTYAWVGDVKGSAFRMRKMKLLGAMKEIELTGKWIFKELGKDSYHISRSNVLDACQKKEINASC